MGRGDLSCNTRNKRRLLISTSFISVLLASPAAGQVVGQESPPETGQAAEQAPAAPAQGDTAPPQEPDIVVTGFRASLNNALNLKRQETAAVDSIVAEDIGKFPEFQPCRIDAAYSRRGAVTR